MNAAAQPSSEVGPDTQYTNWPTAGQELLLEAALGENETAVRAWCSWRDQTDLVHDPIDHGSLRLLPLVYRNLTRHNHDDPLMPRLKGIYKFWWLRNQHTFSATAQVIRILTEHNIEPLVLKGAALSVLHYQDLGARPMADFDVLVPPGRAPEAVVRLTEAGWIETGDRHPERFRFLHGVELVDGIESKCDLHWRLLRESIRDDADHVVRQHSVPITIQGIDARALDATCTLFHTIAHGVPWNVMPSIRWIADAVTILASNRDTIDWDLLHRLTVDRRLILRIRQGLRYLEQRFDAQVPPQVLCRLEQARVSIAERLADPKTSCETIDPTSDSLLASATRVLRKYLRQTADLGVARRFFEFPAYLAFQIGVRRKWGLAGAVLKAVGRKISAPSVSGGESSGS